MFQSDLLHHFHNARVLVGIFSSILPSFGAFFARGGYFQVFNPCIIPWLLDCYFLQKPFNILLSFKCISDKLRLPEVSVISVQRFTASPIHFRVCYLAAFLIGSTHFARFDNILVKRTDTFGHNILLSAYNISASPFQQKNNKNTFVLYTDHFSVAVLEFLLHCVRLTAEAT